MAIFDIYSKRKKRERGEMPDVYTYNEIPNPLRVQIIHIWMDAIGAPNTRYSDSSDSDAVYIDIVDRLRREYGVYSLFDGGGKAPSSGLPELENFFITQRNFDKVMDVIELSFQFIDEICRDYNYMDRRGQADVIATEAIEDLNARFKERGVGYYYASGEILRVDSELIHSEAVKPALIILRQKGYESAEKEFLAAHEHYRKGRNTDALNECYKSFESVMKVICTKRKWTFDKNKAASHLVEVCLRNGLIPPYWQNHFTGLRQILESAIPTPRNKTTGHGAGTAPSVAPPNEITSYVLHMTAATILFLTEAEKVLP